MSDAVRRLLRLWFSLDVPVPPRTYLVSGVGLMALKYALDAALVWATTGRAWPPLQWLHPLFFERSRGLSLSNATSTALVVLALPFLWIGISMSLRRALDAGRSAWWSLLFFVPGLNYVLMASLSVLPTRPHPEWTPLAEDLPAHDVLRAGLQGIAASLAIGVPLIAFMTLALGRYGSGLFFGAPLGMGAITAWWFNRRALRSLRATMTVVILGQALVAGALLLFALEGALCLIMAFPIAIGAGCMGGVLGRAIAQRGRSGASPATFAALALPLALAVVAPPAIEREVITTVEIAAPPSAVWPHVVAFAPLAPPDEWWFTAGIAYPVRARIEGEGVGAVRRCEFSTGAFVEPITTWDAPHRLSFDVIASPPPMQELSPYRHVFAPHLAHSFRARRGEFRLVPLANGRTRLEGSTWYALDMQPTAYWALWTDALIGSIHRRVLEHIRSQAERHRG